MDIRKNTPELPASDFFAIPAWICQSITLSDVAEIDRYGCASGAYMPAVVYADARETMGEHGDDIVSSLEDCGGELPSLADAGSWPAYLCGLVSHAVEAWARCQLDELYETMQDAEDLLHTYRGGTWWADVLTLLSAAGVDAEPEALAEALWSGGSPSDVALCIIDVARSRTIPEALAAVCQAMAVKTPAVDALMVLAEAVQGYEGEIDWDDETGGYALADVIVGAYWYATDYHGGQWTVGYALLSALGRIYTPGSGETGPDRESAAADVYRDLASYGSYRDD